MRVLLLVLVAVMSGFCGEDEGYAGPHSLGPFRIDRTTQLHSLLEVLGGPGSTKSDLFCYGSRGSGPSLWFHRMAHEPGLVGDLLLSDFASCMSRPQAPTSQDLRAWKAEKGIGLGSAEEDVLKAYGRPSRQDGISKTTYRWVIQGDRSAGDLKPERGSRVLVYQGAKHDLSIAEFGFRDGKVVWIFLSINE